MRAPATAPLVLAAALLASSCGGSDGGLDRAGLRECLVGRGAQVEAATAASGLVPGTVASPDFQARIGGATVDLFVEGSADRAERIAADLRGALRSFGVPDPERRLVQRDNAIALFDSDPSAAASAAIDACTG